MNLTDLFEEEDEIGIKDPKASQALKTARTKYGWAENDLEAFLAMVQDEQSSQDKDIESQFTVNTDQEKGIGDNSDINDSQSGVIRSMEKRISNLENGGVQEDDISEGPIDYIGRKLKLKTTNARPTTKHAPKWAKFMAQTAEGAWHWLSQKSDIVGNSDDYFPDGGKTEFSGFVSSPNGWRHSLMPVNDHHGINEADNFTADDLQALSGIRDLATLKARAMALISNTTGSRPMKPEKVAWFQRAIEAKKNPNAIIKLMWDLLLSGEGNAVQGTRFSTDKNIYRKKFNEAKYSAIKLIRLIESNDIDWEPQPAFKGVGGVATSYGDSAKRQRAMKSIPGSNVRRQAPQAPTEINQKWQQVLKQLKTMEPANKKQMIPVLKKIAQAAARRKIKLTPDPSKFHFLQKG